MTLEKQGWLGVLYGFVACLALIVLMGHTFKRDASTGDWTFIGPLSEALVIKGNQVFGVRSSNGTLVEILQSFNNGSALRIADQQTLTVNTPVVVNSAPGDIVFQNTAEIRFVNAAGTDTIPISFDAADSCGIGFKCLRLPN